MTALLERQVMEQFLENADEISFAALFRLFSPQIVKFLRRRGHEMSVAEDLTQEVMLTAYRKAGQLRDRTLFRAWLFKVARNAACRHFARCSRQVPTVDVEEVGEILSGPNRSPFQANAEFAGWMKLLDELERETMTLRFVEEWEYHEIAAAQAVPIGTVQWRVYNSKKKLAAHLGPIRTLEHKAA